jgi:hypothetical protein
MLNEKTSLFADFLGLSKEQSVSLMAQYPFLIPASLPKLKESIVLLLTKRHSLPA